MAINIKTDQVITNYTLKPGPALKFDPNSLYLAGEIRRLEGVIRQLIAASVQVADAAPTEPRKGMIRYAVSPWDPLGTGFSGLVVYDGSAWAAV